MPLEVRATPVAQAQIAGLRGPVKKAFTDFTKELAREGCAAVGYRLSGSEVLERLCVRHLRGLWRVVVCFTDEETAWVTLVAEHVTDPDRNVYDLLYLMIGHAPEPESGRTKPPCCDEERQAPVAGDEIVEALTRRTRDVVGRRNGSR